MVKSIKNISKTAHRDSKGLEAKKPVLSLKILVSIVISLNEHKKKIFVCSSHTFIHSMARVQRIEI